MTINISRENLSASHGPPVERWGFLFDTVARLWYIQIVEELIKDIDEAGMNVEDEIYLPCATLFIAGGKNEPPKRIGLVKDVTIGRSRCAEMRKELDDYTFKD